MALTKKQRVLAGNILQYIVLSEIIEEGQCSSDDEQEVLNELIENIERKIGKIDVVPLGNLAEIIEFVKLEIP
jgi:hypothetical protein